jgi:C1A family cysteine protease
LNKKLKVFLSVFGLFILCFPHSLGATDGDVNGSGDTDLSDVVAILQICAGMNPDVSVEAGEKVGLDDAILAIQIAANILKFWYKDADGDRLSDGTAVLSANRPSDHYYKESELYSISGDSDDTNPEIHVALPPEVTVVQSFIQKNEAGWVADLNPVSSLSKEERKKYLGLLLPDTTDKKRIRKYSPKLRSRSLPSSFDWRDNNGNYVTSVKNQGGCGSCWAFATTAGIESQILITYGSHTETNLSEQIVVSCSDAGSCSGGYLSLVSDFLRDTGTNSENCYAYSATDGNCNDACSGWQNSSSTIDSWSYVVWGETATVSLIKNAIYENGPLVSAFDVYEDFYYYNSGVYTYVWGQYLGGHAILIVGWDDSNSAFIIKNSWGIDWGESGYFRIAYSEVDGDTQFGFWTLAYHMDTTTTTTSTTTTTVVPTTTTTVAPTTTTTVAPTTTTTTIPIPDGLVWNNGNWNEKNWN